MINQDISKPIGTPECLPPAHEQMKHYSCPEGYWDTLEESILSCLPERGVEDSKQYTLWAKLKPLIYMAASFLIIYLGFEAVYHLSPGVSQESSSQEFSLREDYEGYMESYAQETSWEDSDEQLLDQQYM